MNPTNRISYSSINRNGGFVCRDYCNCCSGCRPWMRCKSFFKSFLRLPCSIILAITMSFLGIGLIYYSLIQSTILSDQITYDLFNRKYTWFNYMEAGLTILGFGLCVLILTNLIIGCATNAQKKPRYNFTTNCYDHLCSTASNCAVKTLFIINYILLIIVIAATLTLGICLFAAYTTSTLCANTYPTQATTTTTSTTDHVSTSDVDVLPNQSSSNNQTRDSLNLLIFQPFIGLPQNETQLLIFTGPRLHKFCDVLLPSVLVNIQLCFIGLIMLISGLLNFILTVNTNWTKITTKRKFEEVVFLNSAEMATFDDMD